MQIFIGMVMALSVILFWAGVIRFNKLKMEWGDVISIKGAFLSALGIIGVVMVIMALVGKIVGVENAASVTNIIAEIIITLIFLIPLVKAELKCQSTKRKIMLPFVVLMLTFGLIGRLFFALITRSSVIELVSAPKEH